MIKVHQHALINQMLYQKKEKICYQMQPGLMKVHIIVRQIKTKTRGIDTQKWTLACLCYVMGRVRVVV